MKATKGNKTYTITEQEKKRYQDAGYDIQDDTGKTIAYGRGKTVPYEDYAKLQAENDALKAELASLQAENDASGKEEPADVKTQSKKTAKQGE